MNTNNSQPHEGQGSSQSEKFPEIIESERQGWLVSAQAAAVVAALLCGVEASLLSLVKTDPPPTNAAFKFLLIMSYSALVLNASSTIASLVMLDCLGEMPVLVAKASTAQDTQNADSMDAYLGLFGLGSRWRLARRYCEWNDAVIWRCKEI
ncbi:hypothetical protein FRB94_012348 [Tulasnella sp. JGI-2019a]|nr:hypothetical protein FRB93_000736 [Tulasnella sp. JGI-2019a]KAG9009279.1 hypothetical protein FRB94_012348 [Tulasnella sp. JGI-2019a]KAG9033599.1 hypothetical protein FRB95_014587 [Tulasnella sp. JGI-2019a]